MDVRRTQVIASRLEEALATAMSPDDPHQTGLIGSSALGVVEHGVS
jgi:hypothetical protein